MYMLEFSRDDCPNKTWFFDTIEEIETFVKDKYPKFPDAVWPREYGFYPNGLRICQVGGRQRVLKMRSMAETHEMPECLCQEVETLARLIYNLQGIVDSIEGGVYEWPLDQITPRVDKEELLEVVFHPDRMMKMGGREWLQCM